VPQVMAQFVLKIELLSHIMGTTPILEMARAYGLRPRLWLLPSLEIRSSPSPLVVVFFLFTSLVGFTSFYTED